MSGVLSLPEARSSSGRPMRTCRLRREARAQEANVISRRGRKATANKAIAKDVPLSVTIPDVKVEFDPENAIDPVPTSIALPGSLAVFDRNAAGSSRSELCTRRMDVSNDNLAKYFPGYKLPLESDIEIDPRPMEDANGDDADDTFQESEQWMQLLSIITNEIDIGNKKKPGKRVRQDKYESIIKALETRAETCGFSDEELLKIWKVVSHRRCNMKCSQRQRMMHAMIPSGRVSEGVFNALFEWLTKAKYQGIKPSIVVGVFQLLHLYLEYNKIDYDVISKNAPALIRILIEPTTENSMIPWKMQLFRNLMVPDLICRTHVLQLQKLLKQRGLKQTQLNDIKMSLKFCEALIGEPCDFEGKCRPLTLPKVACDRFYQAMLRNPTTSSALEIWSSPPEKKIFPEFLSSSRKSGLQEVLKLLETEMGIVELVTNPIMMETFEKWLHLYLQARFKYGLVLEFREDPDRYAFVIERCTKIMDVLGRALPVLMEWFVDFFCFWDQITFMAGVFALFPYLEPRDVWKCRELVKRTVFKAMVNESINLQMWQALSELFFVWLEKFNKSENMPERLNYYAQGMEWLLELLEFVVKMMVSSRNKWVDEEEMSPMLGYNICLFYKKLNLQAQNLEDLEIKSKLLTIPEDLAPLVFLTRNPECIELLQETLESLIQLNVDNASVSKNRNFFSAIYSNALVPAIKGVPEEALAALNEELVHVVTQEVKPFSRDLWLRQLQDTMPMTNSVATALD